MNRDDVIDVSSWRRRVPPVGPRLIRRGLAALLVLIVLAGTFYQVQPESVGVVLRFGRYVRTADPGLHMKIPLAESVTKVPVQRQLKQEFGFRTVEAAVRTKYSEKDFSDESMMLTGDLNVAIVEWIVQYRVSDPYQDPARGSRLASNPSWGPAAGGSRSAAQPLATRRCHRPALLPHRANQ